VTGWAPRRFWTEAVAEPDGEAWTVRLDGRPVRTPAKAPFRLPTEAMARAAAEEWAAQGQAIDPLSMPVTRAANAAIDRVAPHMSEVAAMVAAYAETDLLLHRAGVPEALDRLQAEAWDPLLDWAAQVFGSRLVPGTGIRPIPQDAQAVARLADAVRGLDAFGLAALHELVALSGSLVIGLAAISGGHDPESLWRASRIDEEWQILHWGTDEEAAKAAAARRRDFLAAHRFWRLATGDMAAAEMPIIWKD
jgi:chaperone required for assembly of F1-ATPase